MECGKATERVRQTLRGASKLKGVEVEADSVGREEPEEEDG
jgi:hypothetical protein